VLAAIHAFVLALCFSVLAAIHAFEAALLFSKLAVYQAADASFLHTGHLSVATDRTKPWPFGQGRSEMYVLAVIN
jgi:hypothetical protein